MENCEQIQNAKSNKENPNSLFNNVTQQDTNDSMENSTDREKRKSELKSLVNSGKKLQLEVFYTFKNR